MSYIYICHIYVIYIYIYHPNMKYVSIPSDICNVYIYVVLYDILEYIIIYLDDSIT